MIQKNICKTAIVEDSVQLSDGVSVGAYSHIKGDVKLGKGVIVESHVVIGGDTTIGEGTHIFPFASIGLPPQDLKFHGEKSTLVIGKNNTIREHVTMNPGTEGGGMVTEVGDNCLFMMSSHVAHDCKIGNNVILANNATLAGHVTIGEYAIIGGLAAIHQFVRIGEHAMIGGMSAVESDVLPFVSVTGKRAFLAGLNIKGMKRREFERKDIHALRNAYKIFFAKEGTFDTRVSEVEEKFSDNEFVMNMVKFIRSDNSRALCRPET